MRALGRIVTELPTTVPGEVAVEMAAAVKFGLRIHAIGGGEKIDDLRAFEAREVARIIAGVDRVR